MVDEAGGEFFLVHVATPLEECERRDRKGLYAKARARRDPRVHRHLLALRGARGRRRAGRHHRPVDRGRARRRRSPPCRDGLAGPHHDRAPASSTPTEGPVRLHRQHLPLAVHGAAGPAPGRRSPAVAFSSAGTMGCDEEPMDPEHGRRAEPARAVRGRFPQPPAHRRAPGGGRPGAHRGGGAPAASARRAPAAFRRVFPLASSRRRSRRRPTGRPGRTLLAAAAARSGAGADPRMTSPTRTDAAPRRPQRAPRGSTSWWRVVRLREVTCPS